MKITKNKLKLIIQEELANVISEMGPEDRLKSMGSPGVFQSDPRDHDVSLSDVENEDELGGLSDVENEDELGEVNPLFALEEIDSWVGLDKDTVYDLLTMHGAEPKRRNPPWWDDFERNDPVRVKFRQWYNDRKRGGGSQPDPGVEGLIANLKRSLNPGADAIAAGVEDRLGQVKYEPESLQDRIRRHKRREKLLNPDLKPVRPKRVAPLPMREGFNKKLTNNGLMKIIRQVMSEGKDLA